MKMANIATAGEVSHTRRKDLPSSDVQMAGLERRRAAARMNLGALVSAGGIFLHLLLRFIFHVPQTITLAPLILVLLLAGVPLLIGLARRALVREFGSDLLAGISIVTAVLLHEYLVASIVVLMLSGGTALEDSPAERTKMPRGSCFSKTELRPQDSRGGFEGIEVFSRFGRELAEATTLLELASTAIFAHCKSLRASRVTYPPSNLSSPCVVIPLRDI